VHLLVFIFLNIKIPEKKENEEPLFVELIPERNEPQRDQHTKFSDETNKTFRETKIPGKPSSPSGVVNKDLAYITPESKGKNINPEENLDEQAGTYKKNNPIKQFLPSHELIKQLAKEYQPGTDADAETSKIINLDTTELKYISYMTKIKRQIELVWTYPTLAIERGEQGVLILQFTILSNGELKGVKLIRSSGSKILDNSAVEAIQTAAPYPPFPREWTEKEITIAARMEYVLGYTIVQ